MKLVWHRNTPSRVETPFGAYQVAALIGLAHRGLFFGYLRFGDLSGGAGTDEAPSAAQVEGQVPGTNQ